MSKSISLKNGHGILNTEYARHAALIMWSVMKSPRKKVIHLLQEEGELSVMDIYIKLRMSAHSAASQMMRKMRDAGVVDCKRKGKEVYYSLNQDKLKEILSWFKLAPKTSPVPKARQIK